MSEGRTRSRNAGRPHGADRTSVHDDLLAALREALRDKLHFEITIKEVADRAGTSPEMVRYYFGGKDGLIMALLRQIGDRFVKRMDALDARLLDPDKSPIRQILEELLCFYVDERHITRVSMAEFQKGKSRIHEDYLSNRSELVIARIHAMLGRLVEAGLYDQAMDQRRMAMTLLSMVAGPVNFLSVFTDKWVSPEELTNGETAGLLADMIDAKYRRV